MINVDESLIRVSRVEATMKKKSLNLVFIALAFASVECSAQTPVTHRFLPNGCEDHDKSVNVVTSLIRILNKDPVFSIEDCNKIQSAERSKLVDAEYFGNKNMDTSFRKLWVNYDYRERSLFALDGGVLNPATEVKSNPSEGKLILIQTLKGYSSVPGSSN